MKDMTPEQLAAVKARIKDLDLTDPKWAENLELDLMETATGTRPAVRHDCAFCGRERTPKDDNHAPECFYWVVLGGPQ